MERATRTTREKVDGLPAGFRYHDLRHHFASLLIASGADVKTVQARLRHASAKTTLDTYGHIWPDRDESTRAAVDDVIAARAEQPRNNATAQPRNRAGHGRYNRQTSKYSSNLGALGSDLRQCPA